MDTVRFNVALREKPLDAGLTKADVLDLFDMIIPGEEVIPIEIQGEYSAAMGFIDVTHADLIDYHYDENSSFYDFIKDILDDMNREDETCSYKFEDTSLNRPLDIWLSR